MMQSLKIDTKIPLNLKEELNNTITPNKMFF